MHKTFYNYLISNILYLLYLIYFKLYLFVNITRDEIVFSNDSSAIILLEHTEYKQGDSYMKAVSKMAAVVFPALDCDIVHSVDTQHSTAMVQH